MARNTLTKKADRARAKSAGALNLFRSAAAELETAVKEHSAVAKEAGAVANTHLSTKAEHDQQATEAAQAAAKLRDLVGGAK